MGRSERLSASGRLLREGVVLVGTAMLIAFVVKTFVAQAFFIPSGSMEPQLQVGDRVVVSKTAYRVHDPNRGDVVVFDAPNAPPEKRSPLPARLARTLLESVGLSTPSTEEYIKRIVGLPGDTVAGRDGKVFVNGRELIEPYLPEGTATSDFEEVTVDRGELWVMGDNRDNSSDSRVFGPIRRSTVVGRAFMRVWPIPDMSFL